MHPVENRGQTFLIEQESTLHLESGTRSQPARRRRTEEFAASHSNNQSAAGTVGPYNFCNGCKRNAALAAAQEDMSIRLRLQESFEDNDVMAKRRGWSSRRF